MYLRFAFEGSVHAQLDLVPLAVRRKLDLAGSKISLAGWQALSRAERLALSHLPVDSEDEVGVYREVLSGFAARVGSELEPIAASESDRGVWETPAPPASVLARLDGDEFAVQRAALEDAWSALGEEARYALVKLAHPKRPTEKLLAAMGELGLPGAV